MIASTSEWMYQNVAAFDTTNLVHNLNVLSENLPIVFLVYLT
ncbi:MULTISPECIES: hypothetical protein [Cyanophyceae]|nr:hypothetical protein [Phormidium sp. FACHB-592]